MELIKACFLSCVSFLQGRHAKEKTQTGCASRPHKAGVAAFSCPSQKGSAAARRPMGRCSHVHPDSQLGGAGHGDPSHTHSVQCACSPYSLSKEVLAFIHLKTPGDR